MKRIGRLVIGLIMVLNCMFAVGLLLAAFSPYANPASVPLLSCLGLAFPAFLVANICFLLFWLIVRYKYALLSALVLLICFSQIRTYVPFNFRTDNIPEGSIKFLSYNIMAFGDLKKTAGKNEIIAYIKNSGADIICLQEFVVASNRKYLTQENVNKEMEGYPYSNIKKLGNGGVSSGIACYSKYPILSAKEIDYGSDHNGSMIYEIKIGNDTITVVNNHLESNKLTDEDRHLYEGMLASPETQRMKRGVKLLVTKLGEAMVIRSAQADAVAKEIAASKHRTIIVCGDFNDSPISRTHRVLSRNLDDAFTKSGRGLGISYNKNKFYFRIDNILISKNLKSYNCTVDRSIKTSDHYPIWCYISPR